MSRLHDRPYFTVGDLRYALTGPQVKEWLIAGPNRTAGKRWARWRQIPITKCIVNCSTVPTLRRGFPLCSDTTAELQNWAPRCRATYFQAFDFTDF